MRKYTKISSQYWTGETGRSLRSLGPEAQLMGLYLLTNLHANSLGIYYLPITYIAHDISLPMEEVSPLIQQLSEIGFCTYDHESEYIWVHEMAAFQIGEIKSEKDNRVKGVQHILDQLPHLSLLNEFHRRYHSMFHLAPLPKAIVKYKPQTSKENLQSKTSLVEAHSKDDLRSDHHEDPSYKFENQSNLDLDNMNSLEASQNQAPNPNKESLDFINSQKHPDSTTTIKNDPHYEAIIAGIELCSRDE